MPSVYFTTALQVIHKSQIKIIFNYDMRRNLFQLVRVLILGTVVV